MYQPFFDLLQLHRHISSEDEAVITEALQFKKVKAGAILLAEGEYANEIFFIVEGILKIAVVNEKGASVTYYFLKESQFCTILPSFNNNVPAHESIIAATKASVIVFEKQKLQELYYKLPYLQELLRSIMNEMLLNKIQVRNSYLGEDASARYQKFITNQSDIAMRVALNDVASYLGITQQSLSRIRKNK